MGVLSIRVYVYIFRLLKGDREEARDLILASLLFPEYFGSHRHTELHRVLIDSLTLRQKATLRLLAPTPEAVLGKQQSAKLAPNKV